jgi:hypothetical protein
MSARRLKFCDIFRFGGSIIMSISRLPYTGSQFHDLCSFIRANYWARSSGSFLNVTALSKLDYINGRHAGEI